jgi:hypothetical protein
MKVGDGVTELIDNDRAAFTIIEIISDEEIIIQRDNVTKIETHASEYHYEPDPEGDKFTITKRRDNRWRIKGQGKRNSTFLIGVRDEHYE